MAEAVGTFALVFLGAGAVIVDSHTGVSHGRAEAGQLGLMGVALAHGLTLGAMVLAVGGISGGHFNPAVSVAAWLRQRLDGSLLPGYVLAQLGGALLAATCLAGVFPDEVSLAVLGTPTLASGITTFKGLLIEGAITFFLVTVILYVTRDDNGERPMAAFAIGGALVALILFAGPLTGAGANPARYLGPAVVSGNLTQFLVYVFGPLFGGAAAAYLFGVAEGLVGSRDPENIRDDEAMPPRDGGWRDGLGFGAQPEDPLDEDHSRPGEGEGQDQIDAGAAGSLRSLLTVIEDEEGELDELDDYRREIYGRRLSRPSAEWPSPGTH